MRITKSHTKLMIVLHSLSLLIVIFAFGAFVKVSSVEASFTESEGSMVGVSGFTNLNSWRMETKDLKLDASFVISSGNLKNIKSLKFTTPVNSLKSTYSHMDTVVYNMLTAKGFNEITFVMNRQMVLPKMKMVNLIGDLTIGDETRTIDLQLSYEIKNSNEIRFKGLKKLNLHEFGITRSNPILKRVKFDDLVLVQIEMNTNNGNLSKSKKGDNPRSD